MQTNIYILLQLYTVVAPYGDDALRSKRFLERMDDEIKRTEGLNLQDIELVNYKQYIC